MKLICYTVAVLLAASLFAGEPNTTEERLALCGDRYPFILDILPGPNKWHSDSVLGPEPWPDSVNIGYYYRLLLHHGEYSMYFWAERIDVYGEEGLDRIVTASYLIDLAILGEFDAHCGNIQWVSPETVTIRVNPELCYQLHLGETQAEVTAKECE